MQIGPAQGLGCLVGLLPRPALRIDIARQSGVGVGQRIDMPTDPGIDPGRTGLDVLGLRGEPLHQVVSRVRGHRGQVVEVRPRPLRVDMVGGQR